MPSEKGRIRWKKIVHEGFVVQQGLHKAFVVRNIFWNQNDLD